MRKTCLELGYEISITEKNCTEPHKIIFVLDVGYDSYKIEKIISDLIRSVDDISINEEGLLPAFGLDGVLARFSAETKGFYIEKDPQFVNRHWVAHGRMYRDLK